MIMRTASTSGLCGAIYLLAELLLESALHYGRHMGQNRSYRREFMGVDCAK